MGNAGSAKKVPVTRGVGLPRGMQVHAKRKKDAAKALGARKTTIGAFLLTARDFCAAAVEREPGDEPASFDFDAAAPQAGDESAPPDAQPQPQPEPPVIGRATPALPDGLAAAPEAESSALAAVGAAKTGLGALLRAAPEWAMPDLSAGDQDLPPGPEEPQPQPQREEEPTSRAQRDLAPTHKLARTADGVTMHQTPDLPDSFALHGDGARVLEAVRAAKTGLGAVLRQGPQWAVAEEEMSAGPGDQDLPPDQPPRRTKKKKRRRRRRQRPLPPPQRSLAPQHFAAPEVEDPLPPALQEDDIPPPAESSDIPPPAESDDIPPPAESDDAPPPAYDVPPPAEPEDDAPRPHKPHRRASAGDAVLSLSERLKAMRPQPKSPRQVKTKPAAARRKSVQMAEQILAARRATVATPPSPRPRKPKTPKTPETQVPDGWSLPSYSPTNSSPSNPSSPTSPSPPPQRPPPTKPEPKPRRWTPDPDASLRWVPSDTDSPTGAMAPRHAHGKTSLLSHDGSDHALLAAGAALLLWDTRLQEQTLLAGHPSPVQSAAFLDSGEIVSASGGITPAVCVWTSAGQLARRLYSRRAEERVLVVACGARAVVVERDAVSVLDGPEGLSAPPQAFHEPSRLLSAHWLPASERVALLYDDCAQLLQLTPQGRLLPVCFLPLPAAARAGVVFRGRLAAALADGRVVLLHSVGGPAPLLEHVGACSESATALAAVGGDDDDLLVGDADGRVTSAITGRAALAYPAELRRRATRPRPPAAAASSVTVVAVSALLATPEFVIAEFADATVAVCEAGRPFAWRLAQWGAVTSLAWTAAAGLATGSADQSVALHRDDAVLDVPRGVASALSYLPARLPSPAAEQEPALPVTALALHPRAALVAVGARDGSVRVLDPDSGRVAGSARLDAAVTRLAFSEPAGELLAAATASGWAGAVVGRHYSKVETAQAANGLSRQVAVPMGATVADVVAAASPRELCRGGTAFRLDALLVDAVRHPSGLLLVVLTESGCVLVFDAESAELRAVVPTCDRSWRAGAVRVDPAGIYVAATLRRRAAGGLERLVVFELATGEFAAATPDTTDATAAVEWAPDGERLAVAGASGAVIEWALPPGAAANVRDSMRRLRMEGVGVWRKLRLSR